MTSKFLLTILSAIFVPLIFVSCNKEENRNNAHPLLWRIEKSQIEVPGKTYVTYFSYDSQERLTQLSTWYIDSAITPLDSIPFQKYVYQYSGNSKNPIYTEWFNKPVIHSPYYGTLGINNVYNGINQLIYDSVFLINTNNPTPFPQIDVSYYSYSANRIYKFTNRFSWVNGIDRDTFTVFNENIIKHIYKYHLAGSPIPDKAYITTYEFDNKPNPIKAPWTAQFNWKSVIANKNNIIKSLYGYGLDTIYYSSQYQYDSDGYPVKEIQTEENLSPAPFQRNFIVNYRYF